MKKGGLYRQILAWTLLLILSITIVPFQLWHSHEADTQEQPCNPQNTSAEKDACHISIYHQDKGQQSLCGHQIHLHKTYKQCFLCEFASLPLPYFISESPTLPGVIHSVISWLSGKSNPLLQAHLLVIFNKGPPTFFSFTA